MSTSFTESGGMRFFPYDKTRPNQDNGMATVYETLSDEGFVVAEGACGTGKTLMALVPAISICRNPSTNPSRVLIATSVKQQQRAFQDEVERINNNLDVSIDNVSALTVVGLPDMHPFSRNDVLDDDVNVYTRLQNLRDGVKRLTEPGSYDHEPSVLVRNAKNTGGGKYGAYGQQVPSMNGIEYDPYYAAYRQALKELDEDDSRAKILPFSPQNEGLLRPEDIQEASESHGLCPHSIMREAIPYVDVIIANYYHVFDPKSQQIIEPVLDDSTFAIFDEAHNLISRVRTVLSEGLARTTLQKTATEITQLKRLLDIDIETLKGLQGVDLDTKSSLLEFSEEDVEHAKEIESWIDNNEIFGDTPEEVLHSAKEFRNINESLEYSIEDFEKWKSFLTELDNSIKKIIEQEVTDFGDDERTISLRDPQNPQPDRISRWFSLSPHSEKMLSEAGAMGSSLAEIRLYLYEEALDSDQPPSQTAGSVGEFLENWGERDHTKFFRTIELSERHGNTSGATHWQEKYRARLNMHNCIPREKIAEMVEKFAGGVMMSATLQPFDVFKDETGLNVLEEKHNRKIVTRSYGLPFHESNRLTLGIDIPKFKYSNRGSPRKNNRPNLSNEVRKTYRDTIVDFVDKTDGNVLISMPKYAEAWWAGMVLRRSHVVNADKVYIDESSANWRTQKMKEKFFKDTNAVLVTGARGTLVEGIDYMGDRLRGVLVCGVPLENTQTEKAKAVQAAYTDAFGEDNGFEYAFVVPAVRKARQSIGRVIRSDNDIGVRAFADERYLYDKDTMWDGVHRYLSEQEQDEITKVTTSEVSQRLDSFWKYQNSR